MKNKTLTFTGFLLLTFYAALAQNPIDLSPENLELINRTLVPSNEDSSTILELKSGEGGGMAVLQNEVFETGTLELELKGENNPGRSFIGIAFNIQNDSTYEAIYFRPFNFKSPELIRREHSVQYISHPKHTWNFLRTNFEGQYEAEYTDAPLPDDWFGIRLKIEADHVYVYDKKSNKELLTVGRLEKQVSDKIGFWTGNNSKGGFRNLTVVD